MEELKNKKATGPDGIPAELVKALGSAGKRELFEICNEIYTVSQNNDTDVTHYRFNPHQPISVIFGRDVAERVCY